MSKSKRETAQVDLIINGQSAKNNLRDLEAASRKAKAELRGLMPGTEEFNKARANFERINKQLSDTRVQAGLARSSWQKFRDEIKAPLAGFTGAAVLLEFFGALRNGLTTMMEFEKSLKNLSAITGATGDDLKFLREQAVLTSYQTGVAAKDVVEAYKLLASAKPELLSNTKALADMTNQAIILSKASGLDLPEAATRLTDAMNQFGAPAEQAGLYINVLAEASRLGAAEVPDLTESLLKFGTTAKSNNITIQESASLIETLAEKGLKGAEAGTQLRNILLKMSSARALPKEAITQLEKFGVNLDLLANKSLPLNQRLAELSKIQNDNVALTKVFGIENVNAAMAVLQNTKRVEDLTLALGADGLNAAYEQAEINSDNLSSSVQKLSTSWSNIMANQGAIGGFLNWLVKSFTNIIVAIDNVGSEWDILVSSMSGKGSGLDRMKESTKDYILELGKLSNGKSIKSFLMPFDNKTNADFMQNAEKYKQTFVKTMQAQGEAAEDAALLFDHYIKKRTNAMIEAHKKGSAGTGNIVATGISPTVGATEPQNIKTVNDAKQVAAQKVAIAKKAWQDQLQTIDKAIENTDDLYRADLENYRTQLQEKWDLLSDYLDKEKDAQSQLRLAEANSRKEKLAVEKQLIEERYQFEMSKTKEGSFQRQLLEVQKTQEQKQLDVQFNQQRLSEYQELYSGFSGVLSGYMNYQAQAEQNQMAQFVASNNRQRQIVQRKFNEGLITREEYDRQMEGLDLARETKEKEIARKQAERQKMAAVFAATIEVAFAWVKAAMDWTGLHAALAFAATAKLGVLAATPLPEFFDGGYTGPQKGMGIDGKGGFPAILHPNEYVVNAENMQNPYVYDMTKRLEDNNNATTNMANAQQADNSEIKDVMERLIQTLTKGVYGVWDWDYDQDTRQRLNENFTRRVLK